METKTILSGHTSNETAYTCDDYPYGRLRCTRMSWLETNKKGDKVRICHQTINPKTGRANKPKKSTYAFLAAAMFLDENGHVQWDAHSEYTCAAESIAFLNKYREGLTDRMVELLEVWIAKKLAFEAALEDGRIKISVEVV